MFGAKSISDPATEGKKCAICQALSLSYYLTSEKKEASSLHRSEDGQLSSDKVLSVFVNGRLPIELSSLDDCLSLWRSGCASCLPSPAPSC